MARADNRCEHKACRLRNHEIIKRSENNRQPSAHEWDMIKSSMSYGQYSFAGALKKYGFTRIVLTIAHLDNDVQNWNVKIERLKALCQKHHLQLDQKLHTENRKYGRNFRNNNLKLDL